MRASFFIASNSAVYFSSGRPIEFEGKAGMAKMFS